MYFLSNAFHEDALISADNVSSHPDEIAHYLATDESDRSPVVLFVKGQARWDAFPLP
jgi:hypothetical protein